LTEPGWGVPTRAAKSVGWLPLLGGLQQQSDHSLSWKMRKCSCYGEICAMVAMQVMSNMTLKNSGTPDPENSKDKQPRLCGKPEKKY